MVEEEGGGDDYRMYEVYGNGLTKNSMCAHFYFCGTKNNNKESKINNFFFQSFEIKVKIPKNKIKKNRPKLVFLRLFK